MDILLHPEAKLDLHKALDYYNSINSTIKEDFINNLDFTFNKIKQFPNLYPYETKTTQKVVLNKFPYIIIYEKYDNIIMILAIFHTKRKPKY